MKYKFSKPLEEGIIISRPNRFIMNVQINKKIFKCHCPSTGRIGNIEFKDIPCLISKSDNPDRKTLYTVEAISLNLPNKKNKNWIGINQTQVNRYVEFFLKNNYFDKITKDQNIEREVKLGNSRIDFKAGNKFIEVKMPLIHLSAGEIKQEKTVSKFNSFDRLIKHFDDLSRSITKNSKAILLMCYIYDAEPFIPPKTDSTNNKIKIAAKKAEKKGIENWQANFRIEKNGVSLEKYFPLKLFH